ncbi:MAG: cobalamin-dependent protein [Candidatus Thiodiazotropha sp. (ex Epidulcina cf. delphinae)]|nr:cobalamin-dependent protein [Candidatus Thiodiazotropha sp. (ex Epidulcina cf. delphinae)]
MRIMLINPNYRATSIHGMGPQVPLGLLAVGGPLIDSGHDVKLINAEEQQLSDADIVRLVDSFTPRIVMIGHSASTPAHSICLQTLAAIKNSIPSIVTVYGGVHPTYHAKEILATARFVDVIVRGEGEAITKNLVDIIADKGTLQSVTGISYRKEGKIVETDPAPLIKDFTPYRVGWELIENWDNFQCWGLGRASIIQFSRGCPHQCSYCGQRGFWKKWRHRTPEALATEIAWLYRHHGVRFFTFADENPTTSPRQWRNFLEAMIAQNIPVSLTAAIRTTDICRDENILPLYKKAGFCAVMLGIETTNQETIKKIKKGSTEEIDAKAIRLLRKNGILSIAGQVAGLEHDSWKTGIHNFRKLLAYDPDFLNAMYATPFDWTDFWTESIGREVVEHDPTNWDFRHQVLGTRYLKPWQLFSMIKIIELAFHLRPKHLLRMFVHSDSEIRRQLRWCTFHAGLVWLAEISDFLNSNKRSEKKAGTKGKVLEGVHYSVSAKFHRARCSSSLP